MISIYTDGSCLKNPDGPGGSAFVILDGEGNLVKEFSRHLPSTTNNRAEMIAVIAALEAAVQTVSQVETLHVYSDSRYVIDGITKWVHGWKKRNWRTATGGEVRNQDLWAEIDRLASYFNIKWIWVRGHDGNSWNEHVDRLAQAAARTGNGHERVPVAMPAYSFKPLAGREPLIRIKCSSCGSTDVRRDAWAEWNEELQLWEIGEIYDDGFCMSCETEQKLIEEELP